MPTRPKVRDYVTPQLNRSLHRTYCQRFDSSVELTLRKCPFASQFSVCEAKSEWLVRYPTTLAPTSGSKGVTVQCAQYK